MKARDLIKFLEPYTGVENSAVMTNGESNIIDFLIYESNDYVVFLCREFGDVQIDAIEYNFETEGCVIYTIHRGVDYRFSKKNNFTLKVYKLLETSNEEN